MKFRNKWTCDSCGKDLKITTLGSAVYRITIQKDNGCGIFKPRTIDICKECATRMGKEFKFEDYI